MGVPGRIPEVSADRVPLIVAGRRTPLARVGSAFADVPVHDLLAPVLRAVVDASGIVGTHLADVCDRECRGRRGKSGQACRT